MDARSHALRSVFEDTVGPRRRGMICIHNCNVKFQSTRKNHERREVAGPVSQKGTEDKENNRTQNGNEGRHPAKKENKTVKEPKNTRRLWGYKGIRIGEASHPGPGMNEDAETYERKRNMAMGEALKEATVLLNNHGAWK